MVLHVVIVNYNVKYFLKQCLSSVFDSNLELKDGGRLELDVWMVDNDSVDGSVEMVRQDFPQVNVVANRENVGFARANNQALAAVYRSLHPEPEPAADPLPSEGANQPHTAAEERHLFLLLNPDTVVEKDTFAMCADFVSEHPDCGGLCVKMVDGKGNYLKESKRGFPTPEASFYKISGLIHLFPHSKRIAAYYMGHLDEDQTNETEIMPGAFLLFTEEVYAKIGGLDESYFMYGEDIDFSWRIRLAGYRNYYFPKTHIIHYKGESTRKGSMNYVYTFYNAMSIFVRKYFNGRNARLFTLLLQMAIWMRACVAWVQRVLKRVAVPAADFIVAYGGFLLLKYIWSAYHWGEAEYYPPQYVALIIPLYILLLMISSWMHGGYDKPVRLLRIVRGEGTGLLLLLVFYSLLNESMRYSRVLLLAGSVWTILSTIGIRGVLSLMHVKGYSLRSSSSGTTLAIGEAVETARIREIYGAAGLPTDSIVESEERDVRHLQDLIRIERADVVVFCGCDIREVIELMAKLRTTGVEYRIAPKESDYIVGSENILSAEELYIADLDTISTDTCRRTKRTFDITSATLLLLLSPVMIWWQKEKGRYFRDCLMVLVGRETWVGYMGHRGVFQPADMLRGGCSDELAARLMLRYMRHYSTYTDFTILMRNLSKI